MARNNGREKVMSAYIPLPFTPVNSETAFSRLYFSLLVAFKKEMSIPLFYHVPNSLNGFLYIYISIFPLSFLLWFHGFFSLLAFPVNLSHIMQINK